MEFSNYVNWDIMSQFQDMPKEFILSNADKINLKLLKQNNIIDRTSWKRGFFVLFETSRKMLS